MLIYFVTNCHVTKGVLFNYIVNQPFFSSAFDRNAYIMMKVVSIITCQTRGKCEMN